MQVHSNLLVSLCITLSTRRYIWLPIYIPLWNNMSKLPKKQLLISVYGYSPFTLLSGVFSAELSHCIGRFVTQYKRPCIEMRLNHYNNIQDVTQCCIGSFYMSINVSYQCIDLQKPISPYEYFGHDTTSSLIHFEYDWQLRVDYYATTHGSCSFLRLFGQYIYIHGRKHKPVVRVMGNIPYMYLTTNYHYCANEVFGAITVSQMQCIQTCEDVIIATAHSMVYQKNNRKNSRTTFNLNDDLRSYEKVIEKCLLLNWKPMASVTSQLRGLISGINSLGQLWNQVI